MTDWLGTNTYELDVLGRINTVTDYEGRATGYTWNSRNQKLSMTYPDGSQVNYSYDIKGNLLKVLDGNGKETSYTYDALDRMTSEVLPNGVKTTKSYDALSRITAETSTKKDGTVIYSNAYSLDGEGNILSETKKTYENGNKLNTCITDYLYDSNNQLIQTNNSEGILEKYFYDTLGNRIQKERTVPGNGNNKNKNKSSTEISKYTYNNENQILTLIGANEEVAGHYTNGELVTFTYDQRGNVRSISTNSGTIGQYYYDDTNKMTYSINKMGIKSAYTYDGAGRRVKETLEHSNINVPEKASIHVQTPIEELLDSNQNIVLDVKKEINYVIDSTTFDNRVLMVYGMHTKTQRYTYGNGVIGLDSWNDKATAWEDINQKKHDEQLYYVKDFRGSVLALTDYKCKITKSYDYNAFGTPIEKNHVNDQGIRTNIYHYAGYIYDYTTSLYFVNARYYMPETARFMAEDIYRGDGLNRYVYVRNNPLVLIDPTGYACSEVNSADSHLKALLKLIEAYPFKLRNIIGIKTKEQKELIAKANTIKDAIKNTKEYKEDEIFRLLVDETFDKRSYRNIGEAEDVQRLIEYLETGLIVLNINNYNKSNIFNEAGNIIKDIALGMGSAAANTLFAAEKVLFYDPIAGIADLIGWHKAGDYLRRSFNQATNTANSFIKDNVTYHDVFNSAETGTYIAQFIYGSYKLYVHFTSSSVVLKPSYNPALDAKGTGKSVRETLLESVSNQKLKNAVDQIYRPGAKVGDGGLADAVRHQLSTGELVGGKDHLIKAAERIKNLENIIKKEALNSNDLQIAQKLLNDLKNALGR